MRLSPVVPARGKRGLSKPAITFACRATLALAVGMGAVFADINRFTSIVIVDYGTGIRVAAPTSVLASMTLAARQGILVKSGAHLEKLAEVDTVVFDKTVCNCGDVASFNTSAHCVPA